MFEHALGFVYEILCLFDNSTRHVSVWEDISM